MSLHAAIKSIPQNSVFQEIPVTELLCPALRAGYDYWHSKCGSRRFPTREDIHPREIAPFLRYVSLIKVENDDFVYRIVGDVVVMSYAVPLQNRKLSDLAYDEPGFGCYVIPRLKRAAETGEVIAVRGKLGRDVTQVNFTDSENVLLPLGPDGNTVDHIMVFSNYASHPFG